MRQHRQVCELVLVMLMLAGCPGCDLDWEERAKAAVNEGRMQVSNGDYAGASKQFRTALEANPYSAEAMRQLADLLSMLPDKTAEAAAVYQRCLKLELKYEVSERGVIRERAETLASIVTGKIEDPTWAVEDFLWAARKNDKGLFKRRLGDNLASRHLRDQSLNAFMASRGRWGEPTVQLRIIHSASDVNVHVLAGGKKRVFQLTPDRTGTWLITSCE